MTEAAGGSAAGDGASADLFAALRAKPEKLVIGLISGTSADGITAAVVEIVDGPAAPSIRLRGWTTTPYPPEVRERVVRQFTEPATMQATAVLDFLLGELFADAAAAGARAAGCPLDAVDLIASHGQTVAHVARADPADPLSRPATLQLAEAAVIAERTGRPVISDFRPADMAAGGVGAPFVPYADLLLLGGPTGRVAVNLGGIANLTVLPAGARPADVYAFDCGPANMLIDALTQRFYHEPYDRDGVRARRGRVAADLLSALLAHPFVTAEPPKAAGHEQFGRPFLRGLLDRWGGLAPDDLIATATAFAAQAIAENLRRFVLRRHRIADVVAAGGGTRNPALMERLETAIGPIPLRRSDEFGIPAEAKEAIAFALLGHATLMGRPGNLPAVTGARHPAILGTWNWPPPRSSAGTSGGRPSTAAPPARGIE